MKANQNARKEFREDTSGVSPVVATLMLVLVAAGAAVGLNVWMKGFQDDSTTDVATPGDTQTLTIAGSSTVYEFSKAALEGDGSLGLTAFEEFARQAGNPVKVELEKGGSGAGRQAVGLCLVDIGSSSSPVKEDDFDAWPDCDRDDQKDFGRELNVFKVATDAVVFASDASYMDAHCTNGPVQFTEEIALALYLSNGDGTYGTVNTAHPDYPGIPATPIDTNQDGVGDAPLENVTDGVIKWNDLPVDDNGVTCEGISSGDPVEIFDRSDPGGTSEIASEKLFGQKQDQLEDFGLTLNSDHQGDGNQGVWDLAEGNPSAILFTSFGYANDQGMETHDFGTDWDDILTPSSTNIGDEDYDATRPILYITAGKPDAVEQLYLDFVMNAHRNQLISELASFESIY